jgi:hypothetical protein
MKFSKKTLIILLVLITFLGLALRLESFGAITFGYDQARDAIIGGDILKGDIKIQGPASDIAGLHHGVLYWYLTSPFYLLGQNSIYAVKLFLIVTSLISIFITYLLAQKIFKNQIVSLTSAFLCAVSFEAIQYSHWLSNPSLAFVTIPLSFYFLWEYINGKRYGIFLTFFFWALSVHFEIFLLYQIIIFAIILIVYRKIKILDLLGSAIIAGIIFLPFAASEVKFNYAGVSGVREFFKGHASGSGQTYLEMADRVGRKLLLIPYYNVLSSYASAFVIIIVFVIAGAYNSIIKKDKRFLFLFLWFIFPVLLFFTGSTNIYFVFVGCAIPFFILFSYYLNRLLFEKSENKAKATLFEKKNYALFAVLILTILISNMFLISDNKNKGSVLFSVQDGMVLDDQKELIDWIYKESEYKPFKLDTITNPLFVNTTWGYLFDNYGISKYGFMPFWWGYPQNGRFGENIKFSSDFNKSNKYLFLIIEPNTGIPDYYINSILAFEDSRSRVEKTKKFGNLIAEKRAIIADRPFLKEEIDNNIKTGDYRTIHLEGLD